MTVALVVGSVLVMEPIARIVWALAKEEPARTLVPIPAVWSIEVVLGFAVLFAVVLRIRRRAEHADAPMHGASHAG